MKIFLKKILKTLLHIHAFFWKRKKKETYDTVLLVAAGYLGDTFWALQTLPFLKEKFPDATFHLAIRTAFRALAENQLPQDRIHSVDQIPSDRKRDSFSFGSMMKKASGMNKKINPDLVFDLMGNRYSALFCRMMKHAWIVGPDLPDNECSSLYSEKATCNPNRHLSRRYLELIREYAETPPSSFIPRPPVPTESKQEIVQKLKRTDSDRLALLIPGAGWPAKQGSTQMFHEIAEKLALRGFKVLAAGTNAEHRICLESIDGIEGAELLHEPLDHIISLLPHCAVCIGGDTGILHLAASFGIPTAALFCQTNPAICGPLGEKVKILRTECPERPEGAVHFCRGNIPYPNCPRKERMNFPSDRILKEMNL